MAETILPTRTPNWFKKYIDLNKIKKNLFFVIMAAIATGLGGFGGFPEPPEILKKLFSYEIVKWLLLFLLIWQGAGGSARFSVLAVSTSLVTTLIIFIIYKTLKYLEKQGYIKT